MNEYILPTVKELKDKTENGNHKFELVSLFAGGGGSSTGYRMAGGKPLAINEFIPEALKTYKANWPNTKLIAGDIRELTPEDILEVIGKEKGELDLLDGSPPCSAFSTAGSREKGWGKTKQYSDTTQKNVEDLFFDYIRMVRGIMPKVFIAENVSGLAKGKAKGYLNEIMRGLKGSGYQVSCKILNAKWLGVPQGRQRTIFVGVRNDIWNPKWDGNLHPKPLSEIITLDQAFQGLNFTDSDAEETNIEKYAIYKEAIKLRKGEQSQKYFSLVKTNPKSYSPTITATTGTKGAAKPIHWDNRSFTVAEVKRIMSIPDDYILTGNYSQKVERLGRMVAPIMYKHLCENLIKIGVL
tara:strand:- start:135 stop:1193 length:1059 start_codon:yes stop_codon:yes gene_type:complete